MPEISAPMATRKRARSLTSGSRAAFDSTVSPSARLAAISAFSVPPTVTSGKVRAQPTSPFGARASM